MIRITKEMGKRNKDPEEHIRANKKTRPPIKKKRKHGLHPLTAAERRKLPHYASFGERVLAEQRSALEARGSKSDLRQETEKGETFKSRNSRTIFVGNIDLSASKNDIAKLFEHFGEVEEVRVRGIINETRKIPKRKPAITKQTADYLATGQAYVVFKNHARVYTSVSEACNKMNMTVFKDKHIRVTPACETKTPKRVSLFVGNLPFDCMEEELVEAFLPIAEESGAKLVGVRCTRDLDTGTGRGVGFVTFGDIIGVHAAKNKAGDIRIRDRVLRIADASKQNDKRTKAFKQRSKPSRRGSNRRGARGGR